MMERLEHDCAIKKRRLQLKTSFKASFAWSKYALETRPLCAVRTYIEKTSPKQKRSRSRQEDGSKGRWINTQRGKKGEEKFTSPNIYFMDELFFLGVFTIIALSGAAIFAIFKLLYDHYPAGLWTLWHHEEAWSIGFRGGRGITPTCRARQSYNPCEKHNGRNFLE